MWTKKFWQDTAERVISTAAQAYLGSGVVIDFGDWRSFGIGGAAAVLSLLKCLAAAQTGSPDSASLVDSSTGSAAA